jgi:hypothetical protein
MQHLSPRTGRDLGATREGESYLTVLTLMTKLTRMAE